jgi:hypothetical protein
MWTWSVRRVQAVGDIAIIAGLSQIADIITLGRSPGQWNQHRIQVHHFTPGLGSLDGMSSVDVTDHLPLHRRQCTFITIESTLSFLQPREIR